jgi:hypothetical protein
MKNCILLFTLLLASNISFSQVMQTESGDYIDVNTVPAYNDSITGNIYTSKGTVYPVYKGKRGGLYIWKTSKKGTKYKKYLSVAENGHPANLNEIYTTDKDI